mgnify:CR=1 FL=1
MIKNILFDMGNVLIRWEPQTFIKLHDLSEEEGDLLMKELFRSVEWVQLDRGTLDDDSMLRKVLPRLPEHLHEAAQDMVRHWDQPRILLMEGMEELVHELSDKGYGLYLLSNASLRHPEYWAKVPASKYFGDRLLVSAFIKHIKPEKEFFETAVSRFGLVPSECVFIDDSPLNVEAAINSGINGIVFHQDAQLLRKKLEEYGIK